jgi:hypothetical protein
MKELVKTLNNLPKLLKLILCIPAIEIVWSIGRICNALDKNDMVRLVIAILTIVPGVTFMWAIDLVWILMHDRAFAMD